jgi:hypothetical protein
MPRLRGRHAGKRHIAVDTIGLLLTRGEHRRPPIVRRLDDLRTFQVLPPQVA